MRIENRVLFGNSGAQRDMNYNIGIIVPTLQGGGAERCAADLSIIFSKQGHNVIIFTDLSRKITYDFVGALVDFSFSLNNLNGKISSKDVMERKIKELNDLKEQYYIDIAVSFMQSANYLNILSKGNEKVVLTTHSVNSEYAKYFKSSVGWSEHTFKELYQYADLITFPSEYCRKDWIEHYGDKNHITRTIYNPVHTMPVQENKSKENVIIAIGRMHSVKRQWHIIRAFKMVKEKCPDSKLIILGDGQLRNKLEKLILRLGLTNDVEMPGNVMNVQDYLGKAKVFTMTSQLEAFPCSVLEAFSAGVPVVACDCPGGIREELNIWHEQRTITTPIRGECGTLAPYIKEFYTNEFTKEEKMLADEIVYLLQNDKLRCEMGRKARQRAEYFSTKHIGEVWGKEISEVNLKPSRKRHGFDLEKQKSISMLGTKENINIEMYRSYYRLLEKWMILREKKISVKQYFASQGIRNIIIYGMGKMTHHLLEDLKDSDINIVCAIDRGAFEMNSDFPIISGETEIPEADCIIITPVYDVESIKPKLERKTSVPIISLSEVVDKCMNLM